MNAQHSIWKECRETNCCSPAIADRGMSGILPTSQNTLQLLHRILDRAVTPYFSPVQFCVVRCSFVRSYSEFLSRYLFCFRYGIRLCDLGYLVTNACYMLDRFHDPRPYSEW